MFDHWAGPRVSSKGEQHQECVVAADLPFKLVDRGENAVRDQLAFQVLRQTAAHDLSQPINPEQFGLCVPGLNEAIGVEKDPIAWMQRHFIDAASPGEFRKYTQ